jgi:hypothetical protein
LRVTSACVLITVTIVGRWEPLEDEENHPGGLELVLLHCHSLNENVDAIDVANDGLIIAHSNVGEFIEIPEIVWSVEVGQWDSLGPSVTRQRFCPQRWSVMLSFYE